MPRLTAVFNHYRQSNQFAKVNGDVNICNRTKREGLVSYLQKCRLSF